MGGKKLGYGFFFFPLFEKNINQLLCLAGSQARCHLPCPSPVLLFGATSSHPQGWVGFQPHP